MKQLITSVRSENTPNEITEDEVTQKIKEQQNPENKNTEIAANINSPGKRPCGCSSGE